MAICPLDKSYLIVRQPLCQVGILVGMGWGNGLFLRKRPLAYLSPGILGCKTRSREASGRASARRAPTFRKASADLPQGEAPPTARRAACERQAVNVGRYPFHTFSTF